MNSDKEIIERLTRVEEKINFNTVTLERVEGNIEGIFDNHLPHIQERLDEVERTVSSNMVKISVGSWLVGLVLGGVLAYILNSILNLI